jgi:multidrug efflux pump subunit AcrA (membrane-fusion protein)
MFEIMQQDVIRVFSYVPQDAAFGVAPGVDAIVRVPELPDREFPGTVTRIADALQPGTRTLLTEIDIPNPDGALPPGIYCTTEFQIPRKTPSLSVPADALIFDRNGTQLPLVSGGRVQIRKVRVKRDFGTWVEVDNGIKPEIRSSSIRRSTLSRAPRCSRVPRPLHRTGSLAMTSIAQSCKTTSIRQ